MGGRIRSSAPSELPAQPRQVQGGRAAGGEFGRSGWQSRTPGVLQLQPAFDGSSSARCCSRGPSCLRGAERGGLTLPPPPWRSRSRCHVAATSRCAPCWAVWAPPPTPGSEDAPHSPVRCLLRTPVRHGAGMEGLRRPAERRPAAASNQAPRGRLFASPPHPPRSAGTG